MANNPSEAQAPTISPYIKNLEKQYHAGKITLDELFLILAEYIRYSVIIFTVPNDFGIFYDTLGIGRDREMLEYLPEGKDPMSVESRMIARSKMEDIIAGSKETLMHLFEEGMTVNLPDGIITTLEVNWEEFLDNLVLMDKCYGNIVQKPAMTVQQKMGIKNGINSVMQDTVKYGRNYFSHLQKIKPLYKKPDLVDALKETRANYPAIIVCALVGTLAGPVGTLIGGVVGYYLFCKKIDKNRNQEETTTSENEKLFIIHSKQLERAFADNMGLLFSYLDELIGQMKTVLLMLYSEGKKLNIPREQLDTDFALAILMTIDQLHENINKHSYRTDGLRKDKVQEWRKYHSEDKNTFFTSETLSSLKQPTGLDSGRVLANPEG